MPRSRDAARESKRREETIETWDEWAECCIDFMEGSSASHVTRWTLRKSALELVYSSSPGVHRNLFWNFCVESQPVDGLPPMHELLEMAADAPQTLKEQDLRSVRNDVCRTTRLSEEQRESLEQMLLAHAVFHQRLHDGKHGAKADAFDERPPIIYVQALHLIAALPLRAGLPVVDALAVFEFAVHRLCPGYFEDSNFSGFKCSVGVLHGLLMDIMPEVITSFSSAGHPLLLFAFDPLLCLFTQRANGGVLRLWDVLLAEGESVIIFALLITLVERCLEELQLLDPMLRGDFLEPEKFDERRSGIMIVEHFEELLRSLDDGSVKEVLRRTRELMQWRGSSNPGRRGRGGVTRGLLHERVAELYLQAARKIGSPPAPNPVEERKEEEEEATVSGRLMELPYTIASEVGEVGSTISSAFSSYIFRPLGLEG